MRKACLILALALIAGAAGDALAGKDPIDVLGYFSGLTKSKASLKGIGKEKADGQLTVYLGETIWSARDHNDVDFGGTWTRIKNRLLLESDAAGTAGLRQAVHDWIDRTATGYGVLLENLSVDLTGVKIKCKAKETKKRGRFVKFKLVVKYQASALADGSFVARKGSMRTRGSLDYTVGKR